jgi:hypothetical protein
MLYCTTTKSTPILQSLPEAKKKTILSLWLVSRHNITQAHDVFGESQDLDVTSEKPDAPLHNITWTRGRRSIKIG